MSRSAAALTASLFAVLGASLSHSQSVASLPPEIRQKLAAVLSAPPSQQPQLLTEAVIPYLQDLMWPEAAKLDARLTAKPTVDVRPSDSLDAPYTDGHRIIYPALFLYEAQLSSYLLSHDLWVDSGRNFPVQDPVLQRPYATSIIMKGLPVGTLDMVSPVFSGLVTTLACYNRDATCASVQSVAFSATLAFFLAHEYGHIAARDVGLEFSYSVDKELAADAFAFKMLQAFGGGILDDGGQRDYYALAAVALLEARLLTLPAGQARDDLSRRREALLNLVPGRSKREFARLVPKDEIQVGMGSLAIQWSGQPAWIAIDGIQYTPGEIAGTTLRVTTDLHEIVASNAVGLAAIEVSVDEDGLTAPLSFHPTLTGPVSDADLAQLVKDDKYDEIIWRTATPQLKPRMPALAYPLFRALDWFHLNRFIDSALLPADATEEQRRDVRRWAQQGVPLAAWIP